MTIPFDFQWAALDLKKDIDVDIKFDFDAEYDLDVDIEKDVKVDLDIKTDVDLDDNSALLTATFENVGHDVTLIGDANVITDDLNSAVNATVTAVGVNQTQVTAESLAHGENTFAELEFNAQAYDFGATVTIIGRIRD